MRLYLVRHGQAQPRDVDPERGLSPDGRAAAEKMAAFLKPLGISVAAIWHSGKARARQTAEILARAVTSAAGLAEHADLAPLDDVDTVWQEIQQADDDLMIVGHMPFQSRLASALLAGDPEGHLVAFTTAAACCLARDDERRTWHLAWMVSPELIH